MVIYRVFSVLLIFKLISTIIIIHTYRLNRIYWIFYLFFKNRVAIHIYLSISLKKERKNTFMNSTNKVK